MRTAPAGSTRPSAWQRLSVESPRLSARFYVFHQKVLSCAARVAIATQGDSEYVWTLVATSVPSPVWRPRANKVPRRTSAK